MSKITWSEINVVPDAAGIDSHITTASTAPLGSMSALAPSVKVFVQSSERQVSFAVKPGVIAKQARQERLNQAAKLGYMPISRSTGRK